MTTFALLLVGLCMALYMAAPQVAFVRHSDLLDYTPVSAVTAGDLVLLPDGRAAFAIADIAAGKKGTLRVSGQCTAAAATGTTFTAGEAAWWDVSAAAAVAAGTADISAGDFPLGPVLVDKVSGTLVVYFDLNGRQRTSSADQGTITDSTGGTKSLTFAAITAGGSYAQADMVSVKNALAQLAASHNAMRTALANAGIEEGQA